MAYYSSTTCGYDENNNWQESGCKNDYASSEIKYVVDAWKAADAPLATEARLITYDELMENAEKKQICTGSCYEGIALQYDWLYNSNYYYWAMSPCNDSTMNVWNVNGGGSLDGSGSGVNSYYSVVRPVITLLKSAL